MPAGSSAPAPRRVALVTGGARGLGRAIAARLAALGIAVVVGDVDEPQAIATASELGDAVALRLDVADEASVAAAMGDIERRFDRLDILVNNAGILGLNGGVRPTVLDMPLELWRRTLEVNLTGTFLMCRGAAPLMRRHRWGRIVN